MVAVTTVGSAGSGVPGPTDPGWLTYCTRSRPAAAVACPAFVAFVALAAEATPASELTLMSAAVSDPFFTFAPVTAFFLSCLEPTLFVGSRVTAYELPPMATNRAMKATTIAGDGRRRPRMGDPPSRQLLCVTARRSATSDLPSGFGAQPPPFR